MSKDTKIIKITNYHTNLECVFPEEYEREDVRGEWKTYSVEKEILFTPCQSVVVEERVIVPRMAFLDAITIDDMLSKFFIAEGMYRIYNKVECDDKTEDLEYLAMQIQDLLKKYKASLNKK